MTSRTVVRVALIGIVAVLATAFTVADARSQPGRPGVSRPPSFPRPPSFSPPGIPRPPSFSPPGIPRPPSFDTPSIPRPPSFNPPRFETVWKCGKCQAELGTGNVKPSLESCPRCGVHFVNGGGGGGFGLINPPPPAFNGGTPPPTGGLNSDPDLLPRGEGENGAGDNASATAPPASGSTRPEGESGAPASKTGSLILKIMIGAFALLFLLGLVGGAFLIFAANRGSNKPARRNRRKYRNLDDDDE